MKPEKKYVSEAICVAQYRATDSEVRLRVAEAEKAFSDMFTGQSQQTNVPDNSDPSVARLIFQGGQKHLSISQKGCQLNFSFERNEKSIEDQLLIIKKNMLAFQNDLLKFKPKENWGEFAVVLSLNFPCKESRELMLQHMYHRFFKVDQQADLGSLASYSFKVGYKTTNQLYLNYETDVYELRSLKLNQPASVDQVLRMNLKDVPVTEEGFGVRVDVNNKPKAVSSPHSFSGVDELMSTAFDFITNRVDGVMGFN